MEDNHDCLLENFNQTVFLGNVFLCLFPQNLQAGGVFLPPLPELGHPLHNLTKLSMHIKISITNLDMEFSSIQPLVFLLRLFEAESHMCASQHA